MKVVAEFPDKTQRKDLMKYLLMIATLAAFISTATAASPAADFASASASTGVGPAQPESSVDYLVVAPLAQRYRPPYVDWRYH